MKKSLIIAVAFFVLSAINVQAMTGVEFLDFLSKQNDSTAERKIVNIIIVKFVGQGYKNVPDWYAISEEMQKIIRKNGYATKDVESIALEAAIAKGMTKK